MSAESLKVKQYFFSLRLLVNIHTFKLNNGLKFPALGYGTSIGRDSKFQILFKELPQLVEAMSYAIDIGYPHIDTAHVYNTEPEVGYVVRKKIKEGVINREDMFITTKVWQHNHRPADVETSVRGSLQRMGLDYIDLMLMHWPMSISADGVDEKIDYLETWSGFESVLKQGLVKSIGVSNFNLQQMERLLKNCQVKPVVNQVELNINLGQKELVSYCQKNDVLCIAYTPFGTMMPGTYNPNNQGTKADNPELIFIAKKHGKTVGQVALRYLYERGLAAIPKTLTKSRVVENALLFDFKLDASDVEILEKFDKNYHSVLSGVYRNYEHYPFEKIGNCPISHIPLAMLKWDDRAKIEV